MSDTLFATARVFTGKSVARGYVRDRATGKVVWACDHTHTHRLFQIEEPSVGDMGDDFRAYREDRRKYKQANGVRCPKCSEVRPKAHPSILLPGQKCRVDGYVDPRATGHNTGKVRS